MVALWGSISDAMKRGIRQSLFASTERETSAVGDVGTMITEPIVFVLGAGSMKDFGFPIGWELVRDVISHFQRNSHFRTLLAQHTKFGDEYTEEFIKALDGSAQNSVDSFLEERWSQFLRQRAKVDSPMQRMSHHEDSETVFG